MLPSLLFAFGLGLYATAQAQALAADAPLARSREHATGNAGPGANPFLRNAPAGLSGAPVPAPVAPSAPAQPPEPPAPAEPPEVNPIKLNGKRLGAVNGKSVYRDGDAYFFDDTDKPLTASERAAATARRTLPEALPAVLPPPVPAPSTKPAPVPSTKPAAPANKPRPTRK